MKYTKKQLIQEYQKGKKLKYLFFWGHTKNPSEQVDNTYLSQWYHAKFEVENLTYPTAEHYMMAEKARLFKDKDAEAKILNASSPGEAKSIGRQVAGFNQELWEGKRGEIVVKGNYHKFVQNEELKQFLLNTLPDPRKTVEPFLPLIKKQC